MNCREYVDASVRALMANPVPSWPIYQDDPERAWRYAFRIIGHGLDRFDEKDVHNEISGLYSRIVAKSEFGSRRGVTIDNKQIIDWILDARNETIEGKRKLQIPRKDYVDMSGKTVTVEYSKKWQWWLSWGGETFYTEDRIMRTWESKQDAIDWLTENHPNLKIVDVADGPEPKYPTLDQLPLFKETNE